ncbi:hypothetical protein ACR79M_00925 [Sphingobacterium spiritivorum]|uniref:hypothetical protein n=1 Tax=Sphingobacterium spiritivorum TaxID=258 RepID=UPI001919C37C|nr:hypothetical protein [Sphingobacterium spiritivorum]QQT26190.1 hypothetical protein I6J02_21235 [Sphingobacterium spiritivorum]
MLKSNLKELSIERLTYRKNLIKGILIGAVIVWIAMLGMAVYVYLYISSLKLFIPVAALPVTLIPMVSVLKVLNTEIKNRSIT